LGGKIELGSANRENGKSWGIKLSWGPKLKEITGAGE